MKSLCHSAEGKRLKPGRGRSKRLVAMLLCAVLAFGIAAPVMAGTLGENTPKQEVIYINLNTDGSVDRIYVVNIFELSEDGQIIDYGDYTALRNLTTNDAVQFENQTVKIDTKAGKLYYEGELDRNIIPWVISIRYYFDGIEYPAEDLAGKSGNLEIAMTVRQNPACNSTFFDSFALQATFTFDTGRCKNIVTKDATMANVGSNKQLMFTLLPGRESDITITAEVTGFEMSGISINGLPLDMGIDVESEENDDIKEQIDQLTDAVAELDDGANELKDGALELRDGALELKDGVTELQDGTDDLHDGAVELRDGAEELRDGVTELWDGTGELYDGVVELRDGADDLYDGAVDLDAGAKDLLDGAIDLRDGAFDLREGARELTEGIEEAVDGALKACDGVGEIRDGAAELADGAAGLSGGLGALSGNSSTLVSGAYTVFTQLTAQAQAQLNASLEAAGVGPVTLTPSGYADVINELLNMLSGGAYAQAEAAASANIRAQAQAIAAAQIEAAIRADSDNMDRIKAGIESVYGTDIDAATMEEYIEGAIVQQIAMQMAEPEAQVQIDAAVQAQLLDEAVQAQIADAVNSALGLNAAYQGIVELKNQLDQYNKNAGDDSFGLVAISSIGPILAVMLLGIFFNPGDAAYTPTELVNVITTQDVMREFLQALPHYAKDVLISILPIAAMFVIFQLVSHRYRPRQCVRVVVGLAYTYIGLVLFLTGVSVGFAPVGSLLGAELAASRFKWLLVPIGMLIGYFIVKAEPAIQVLNRQVESVTGGSISASAMNRSLSIGVAASVGLAMLRCITGISIRWIIIPGYIIALILSRIVPPIFVGIAFDSGGVASGPMTSTFLLPLCIGVCEALGGNIMTDAFGVIALVAMTPLIAIQIMGVVYKRKTAKGTQTDSLPVDELNDIEMWEEEAHE